MGAGIAQLAATAGHPVLLSRCRRAGRSRPGWSGSRPAWSGPSPAGGWWRTRPRPILGRIQPSHQPRRAGPGGPGDRGDRRGSRPPSSSCSAPWRSASRPEAHPGQQHLLALDHRAWRRAAASRAPGRHALLQPGAGDAAGRGGPRPGQRRRRGRHRHGDRPRLGQDRRWRRARRPGFIVNRVARPFYGEALRALAEGAADVATIDAVHDRGRRLRPWARSR